MAVDPARLFANPPQRFDPPSARAPQMSQAGWDPLIATVAPDLQASADQITASLAEVERTQSVRKLGLGVMGLMSVAMVALGGYWGYEALKRQTLGVPVIAAPSEPFRVPPDDPGGVEADHMGLAVNEIAAGREAGPAAAQIILAPPPVELIEDVTLLVTPEAEMPQAAPEVDIIAPDSFDLIGPPAPPVVEVPQATEDLITALLAEALGESPNAPQPDLALEVDRIPASVAGVAVSLIPTPRPFTMDLSLAQVPSDTSGDDAIEIDPSTLAAGDMVVQLGAFDSPDAARREWDRLAAQYDGFFEGRGRVIMAASSGGQEFFRLRVAGFDGVDDARRFCTALLALGQACIPATIR
ncbi:SPOR domain-containing protein [Rhodobacterales bacterium FZCC0188]|jgi:hypothetical protein|nr:SPOR domain-containing protein [Rhodobacterales bacterium FZCC0188]